MQAVVSPEGTGKKAIIQGYAMGGKTGTAEQGTRDKTNYTLSFIGYLSVDNPDIVVMTIIHRPEGYYDGCDISPAPMLKSIMEKIIQYEAIPPTGDTTEDVTSDTDTVTIKDYKGQSLKNTIQELVGLGLDFEILGSGGDTITSQHPEAGTAMEKGGKVLFNTETKGTSELISVPDVTGLSETDAKQMLEAVGFSCYVYDTSTAEEEGSTETTTAKPADTESTANASEGETDTDTAQNAMKVTEQSPAAGKKVEAGTLVQIKLAASE
jgi:stage V sporulation protein D (sporulation-specific penicillin-binding protein)